jgi:4-hydroxy-tetrahydrodipicolinate synthase
MATPANTTTGSTGWRGIFPIPVTPFAPDLAVDHPSLRRQVAFCVDAGCHGIVYPGVASEFFTLTDDERHHAARTVIDEVSGRVPVIVGVAGASTPAAAAFARHAKSLGASGVMATLPYVKHFFDPNPDFIRDYYGRIADAFDGPVILQNARIGFPVSPEVLRGVVTSIPHIRYLKEESSPSTHRLSATIATLGDSVDGVFAGLGGVYLLNELARGAVGSMPAPPVVDLLCRCYDAEITGDHTEARRILDSLAPLFSLDLLYNIASFKHVLAARGIIAHTACRVPAPSLDQPDQTELDEHLRALGLLGDPIR